MKGPTPTTAPAATTAPASSAPPAGSPGAPARGALAEAVSFVTLSCRSGSATERTQGVGALEFVLQDDDRDEMMKVAAQEAEKGPPRDLSAVEDEALRLLREFAREVSNAPARPPLRPDRRNRYFLGSQ